MLFHEIYGSYYNVIAAVLSEAIDGTLDGKKIRKIVREKAFDESILNVPDKLVGGGWNLLSAHYETPLTTKPQMYLTTLQKRWLKALLLDPRIQLFAPDASGLEEITPLFTPEMIVYYDRNLDGDPYEDPKYIEIFHVILEALRAGQALELTYQTHAQKTGHILCRPEYLEYSPKDDKFRVRLRGLAEQSGAIRMVNIGRISDCRSIEPKDREKDAPPVKMNWLPPGEEKRAVTLEVTDFRNTLERILLHFSHLEKETRKLGARKYHVKLVYDASDETEMLIRILAFGPSVKVLEPEAFLEKIRDRLKKQKCQWSSV